MILYANGLPVLDHKISILTYQDTFKVYETETTVISKNFCSVNAT